MQVKPPFCGRGLSQERVRIFVPPPPHVTVHKSYADHDPHSPLTEENDKIQAQLYARTAHKVYHHFLFGTSFGGP